MYAPPAEIVFGPVRVLESRAKVSGVSAIVTDISDNCTLTITPDDPQWNAVTIACMYGKKSMLLNPRRAVELALLSGTIRRMR